MGVMVMVTVTGTLMVTDHTIMERGALMPNLMVITAMHRDTDTDLDTTDTITASVALMLTPMLTPMLMLTIMVTMVTVWDPFTVMVTTHTQPVTMVTMVTTWASVALKNNLDLILNLMPMGTIPAIMVDTDMVDTVDMADITGAKLTDQTTSHFS